MSTNLEDILKAHEDLIHTVSRLTNAILQGPPKRLYQKMVVTLDLTSDGNKAIDLPFAPLYLGVVNESSVPVTVSEGRQAQAATGAATVDAGGQQAMFLAENTRTVTLSWSMTPGSGQQTVVLYVSNEPLPMFTNEVYAERRQKNGVLAQSITVAAGTTYTSPALQTAGYSWAAIWPTTPTGGTLSVNRRQYGFDGTLIGFDGASNGAPPYGMSAQGYAAFYQQPVFDYVDYQLVNSSGTEAAEVPAVNFTLSE